MDKKTIILVVALGLVALFWFQILEFVGLYEPPPPVPVETEIQTDSMRPSADTPVFTDTEITPQTPTVPQASPDRSRYTLADSLMADTIAVDTVIVETESYRAFLVNQGGAPVSIQLKDYTYRDGRPIEMIPGPSDATPELTFADGHFRTGMLPFVCSLPPGTYDASDGSFELSYTYTGPNGGSIVRRYFFEPERHSYRTTVEIDRPDLFEFERDYELTWNTPLDPTEPDVESDYQAMEAATMMGGSRDKLDDYKDDQLNDKLDGDVSWVGVRSKYFAAALIPNNRVGTAAIGRGYKQDIQTIDGSVEIRKITAGVQMSLYSGAPVADTFTVFVGPLDYMKMSKYQVGLEDMLNIGTTPVIGWLIKWIAIGIMWLLPKLYSAIPNYGLVIILFAFMVKIITMPLSMKSFKSMQAMKDLQPKIDAMKKKHGKDAQKMNQEMMKMYKQHGVNPISGCLPILPQMPLFFALFSVFRSTILLRDAPFVWFINDLSRGATGFTDPYIILVLIMVVAQFVSQKLTMAQSQQNKALGYIMPLFMGFIFYKFAAGLVLYWTCFSVFSLLDYVVFKRNKNVEVKTA